MPKLFQIFEDDLAELERVLPQIASALTPILAEAGANRLRADSAMQGHSLQRALGLSAT